MKLIVEHWSFDPFLVFAVLGALVYTVGLRRRVVAVRRAGRQSPYRVVRAVAFFGGLVALVIAIDGPVDYWSDTYLFAHMLQHLLLAFIAPALIVVAAPWLELRRGLPRLARTVLARGLQAGRRSPVLRRATRVVSDPVVAFAAFNAAMVAWHLPGPFDLGLRNNAVHIWAEHGSLFGLAMLLWLQLLDSPPLHPRWPTLMREAAALGTNAVMVGIAITLVLLSHPLYAAYQGLHHVMFSQYSDQQIAGGTLWVCGELSLAPTIYWNVVVWLRGQQGRPSSTTQGLSAEVSPWARAEQRWHQQPAELVELGWLARRQKLRYRPRERSG